MTVLHDQNLALTVLYDQNLTMTALYDQNLALTVFHAPYSLDGGKGETRDVIAALEERGDSDLAAALPSKEGAT